MGTLVPCRYKYDAASVHDSTTGKRTTGAEISPNSNLTEQMARTGVSPDTLTLLVVDATGQVVRNPNAH